MLVKSSLLEIHIRNIKKTVSRDLLEIKTELGVDSEGEYR